MLLVEPLSQLDLNGKEKAKHYIFTVVLTHTYSYLLEILRIRAFAATI